MEKNCKKIFPFLNRWNWQKSCSPFSTSWSIQHPPNPPSLIGLYSKGGKDRKAMFTLTAPFSTALILIGLYSEVTQTLVMRIRLEDGGLWECYIDIGIDNDGVFPSYCWADLFSLIFLSALVINQWHPTISPLCYELILQTICFLKSHTI